MSMSENVSSSMNESSVSTMCLDSGLQVFFEEAKEILESSDK